MNRISTSATGRVVALLTALALCLLSAQTASAAASASAPTPLRQVAQTDQGTMSSRIVGTTANGRKVSGAFVPLSVAKRDGRVSVRGLVQGVVHEADGDRSRFSTLRTLRLKSVNGTPVGSGRDLAARASCSVLNLVLAPLDLDLLGLQVHLDRVVLPIVAQTGAGNLLGNLLCAVTGLLDGGLDGLLGRLTTLLERVLGALRLG